MLDLFLSRAKIILDKTDLVEGSKKTYLTYIKKIYIISGATTSFSLKFFRDVDFIKSFAEKEPDTTSKMIYTSLGTLLKNKKGKGLMEASDKYRKLTIIINKKIESKDLDNLLSNKQKGKLIPFSELKKDLDTLKEKYDKHGIQTNKKRYLLGIMYLGSGFTPRLDYSNMKILKSDMVDNNKDNFLKITKSGMTIILNNYKTDKQYGKITFNLPKSMVTELKRLNIPTQEFLFENGRGGHLRKNKFSEFVKRTFNSVGRNNITVNDIRIIKESYLQSRDFYQKLSQNERNKLHLTLFQHNSNVAQSIYRKIGLEDITKGKKLKPINE